MAIGYDGFFYAQKGMTMKMTTDKLMRLPQVLEVVPVSKSTWWNWCKQGIAPAPVRLGRTTCWRESDVMALMQQREG